MPRRLTHYKVIETQTVTEEELERILNEGMEAGWVLDGIQFAMRESSKRPAMAFVIFTCTSELEPEAEDAADEPDV